jgi:hypothetical protein
VAAVAADSVALDLIAALLVLQAEEFEGIAEQALEVMA